MYLLNRKLVVKRMLTLLHLHSTMYLLNPAITEALNNANKFTFHYVSIKSIATQTNSLNNVIIYIPLCIY